MHEVQYVIVLLSNTSVHFYLYSTLATAPVSSSPVLCVLPLAVDGAVETHSHHTHAFIVQSDTAWIRNTTHQWFPSPSPYPLSIRRNSGQKLTLSPGGVSMSTPDMHNMCLTALNNIHRVHGGLRRHISAHFTEPGDHNWQQIS